MPKLPKEIILTVDENLNPKNVTIDGEEFPWHLTADAQVSRGSGLPVITLTIPADQIIIQTPQTQMVFPSNHGDSLIVNLPDRDMGNSHD